jgi:hypothetical protein
LLIRELAVRRNLGTAGIIVAGFAYAFYNEGLWAKTMVLTSNMPITSYNDYGVILGIAVPWALFIAIWHALASVLFPIIFVNMVFPNERDKPWFDPRFAWVAAIVLLAFAGFVFMQPAKQAGTPIQLGIFEGVIVVGIIIASRMRRPEKPIAESTTWLALMLGLTTVIPLLAFSAIANAKVWVPLFVVAWWAVIAGYSAIMRRSWWQAGPNLTLFGLGFYIQTVFFATLVRVGTVDNALEVVLTGGILGLALTTAAVVLQVRSARQDAAEPEPVRPRIRERIEEPIEPAPAFTMLRARQASEQPAQSYPRV